MITKQIELIINTGQAEQALQGVDKAVNRIDKNLVKTDQEFDKLNKDAKQLDNNLKEAPNSCLTSNLKPNSPVRLYAEERQFALER